MYNIKNRFIEEQGKF